MQGIEGEGDRSLLLVNDLARIPIITRQFAITAHRLCYLEVELSFKKGLIIGKMGGGMTENYSCYIRVSTHRAAKSSTESGAKVV